MFSGSIVALITPFSGGTVDEVALRRLVRWHLENGTHGIVPVGTTGESPTLSFDEHKQVVAVVVAEVAGQIPVLAGAGSNNTAEAIALTRCAVEAGADGVLHVMGYYNRPNSEGVFQHFRAVADASDLPVVVYNIPSRTGIDIDLETMARLAAIPTVVGVKDATRDISRPLLEGLLIDGEFSQLSGEDPTAVAYNAQGGVGCISVSANVFPALSSQMQQACLDGDYAQALRLQSLLMPLHQVLFHEPSPAGVKYACSLLGLCEPQCRLPIVPLRAETQRLIEGVVQSLRA